MSEIAERAKVSVVMADFANTDAAGKANIVGGGVAVVGFDPNTAITSSFTVWIDIWIPTSLTPTEFPVEVALIDSAGDVVGIPGPAGVQALRVAQVVQVERPMPQLPNVLRDHIGSRVQLVFQFGNGLPVRPGGAFTWRIQIDGDEDHQWNYPWAVVGAQPGPVIG